MDGHYIASRRYSITSGLALLAPCCDTSAGRRPVSHLCYRYSCGRICTLSSLDFWNLVDDVSQFPFYDPRCPSLVLAASDIVRLSGNISHSPNPGSMFCFLDSDYGPVFRGSIFCVLYPVLCILLPCVQDSMIIVDTFNLKASQC